MDASATASQQQPQGQGQMHTSRNSNGTKRVQTPADAQVVHATIFKVPKRKRLVKACDHCHKSKRRCDGTAPCSNCYFASKDCAYTDSAGRPVPAPNAPRSETINSQLTASPHSLSGTSISAPGAVPASYPPPVSPYSHSHAQHSVAAQPLSSGVPGSSYFVARSAVTPSARFPFSDPSQPRGVHGRDLLHDHPPPRKRPKGDRKNYDRNSAYRSQTQAPSAASVSFVGGSGHALTSPENSFLRSTNATGTIGAYHKHVVRELVNLFFAHCHPHRLIIHSISFLSDLTRNRVPSFLLNAVCAVSAPLSQNPDVRVSPVRDAGQKFVEAASAELFDAEGRLKVTGLEAAQALVLLQTYQIYRENDMSGNLGFFDLALRLLHNQHIFSPSTPSVETASLSSDELQVRTIKHESERRTFWFIHLIELLGAIFSHHPTTYSKDDLAGVRLPCDEASFDLCVLKSSPEYLDSPALKTRGSSEFGHTIRIATLLRKIEDHNIESPDAQSIANCESQLEQWVLSLSDQLKYDTNNLHYQLSVWETGSNSSTWCYCFMHILHACAIVSLSDIRKRLHQGPCRDHRSALTAVPTIMNALGPRARNSIMMGSVLWLQYCGPHASSNTNSVKDDPADSSMEENRSPKNANAEKTPNIPELQLDLWIKEWEEFWGPTHIHGNTSTEARMPSTAVSMLGVSVPITVVQTPLNSAPNWNVPDVVIDPVLRADDEHSPGPQPQASPALSSTSTLRGRDQPSLPSLKSSGLLDVFADDLFGRASGASTPVKPPPPWPLGSSVSPRPPLLSPGLPVPATPAASASVSAPAQPHTPHFGPSQAQQTPQLRPQARGFYQHNRPIPSPGVPKGGGANAAWATHSPPQGHVPGHDQTQSYFDQTPSPLSPHEHMLALHGSAEAPSARR